MLERGVYLPPSGYECWFLSAAHAAQDVNELADAAVEAISRW
jgi:glutamate-1-semialdehyde 2,1-aminomutase